MQGEAVGGFLLLEGGGFLLVEGGGAHFGGEAREERGARPQDVDAEGVGGRGPGREGGEFERLQRVREVRGEARAGAGGGRGHGG